MKKLAIIPLTLAFLIMTSGCTSQTAPANDTTGGNCVSICRQAVGACAEFMSEEECNSQCASWDKARKDQVETANNCSEMPAALEDRAVDMIPAVNIPNLASPQDDCDAACGKYVTACLMLVPNASESLFAEGHDSCLEKCAQWDSQKVDCMINAFNCQAMTEECGL